MDIKKRLELIKRNISEIIGEDELKELLKHDSFALFKGIQVKNPFAKKILKQFFDEIETIKKQLR